MELISVLTENSIIWCSGTCIIIELKNDTFPDKILTALVRALLVFGRGRVGKSILQVPDTGT